MDVSVIIPTYRNARVLLELARRLVDTLSASVGSFEIILIDDGNRDNTWAVISDLAAKYPQVKGIRLSRNFGQHPAIAAGFKAAQGQRIVLMDADLEDRPEAIPELLAGLDGGVDIVFTVIANPNEHSRRRITSMLFRGAFSYLSPMEFPPNVGTLRAFTRQVLEAIRQYNEYNVLYGPLMFYLGFNCKFIEVMRGPSALGGSSYSFRRRLRLASATLFSYTNLPNTIFLVGGGILLGLALLYILLILGQYIFFGPVASGGFVFLALLALGGIAVNLIAFGVIGTYVYRVYQEVLGRPRYHVMAVTGSMSTGRGQNAKGFEVDGQ